ncbi:MAG: 7-cyano-7-deazaguanine synthase QueC [Ignavibacteria bacterium]|jgi:7-cyano-7-deazaguanine synthase|nr:7-cyano-7-deazaguanine synthase QueC [Ignavibacteria bacterium]
MNKKAVVLLSGGMDSLLTLSMALNSGYYVYPLHLNYGQATEPKEYECFNNILKYYGLNENLIVDVEHLRKIGGSTLTDANMQQDNADIPNSYVPFRNANILAIATSWAEVIGASALYIGASEVDYSGYPDCRREFFDAFEQTIRLGTKPDTHITIETPLIRMTKADIVNKGIELAIPFELSWSCYYSNDEACGECDSCKLRLKGFAAAGIKDPIKYKKNIYL